ncbi:MAG: glycosyltransferase [Cytophaga sp.]|uniref:glycosyltransferase n=1 Tax=Cytophaga sp. TaxID=29535 RepID=UPI003F7D86F7
MIKKIAYKYIKTRKVSSKGLLEGLSLPSLPDDKTIVFKQHAAPDVSIIIPIYNQAAYTINCLSGLYHNISNRYTCEIIVVNDQSTDNSLQLLTEKFSGIHVITNASNLGFVRSCNAGAAQAKGTYICFLNNDTYVQPNWLEVLVDRIKPDNSIGLVGSMLIYPNGELQEAGGIIWNNGNGYNFGKHDHRYASTFNYVREADYISGASILLRKEDFNALGGFDELFVPAYYEDTDLCFSVRHKLNKKVVYCPASKALHYEGITSGTNLNAGVKKHQVINKEKFLTKWKKELDAYYFNEDVKNIPASLLKYYKQKHILIIDSYVPCYNKESGSNRLFRIIKIIQQLGYKITFLPDDKKALQPYTHELQEMGVEVLFRSKKYYTSIVRQLNEILPSIDIAWICRPELFEKYHPGLSKNQNIKFIYDTIDLHFLRLKRENELFPHKKNDWKAVKNMELSAAGKATVTLAITPADETILRDLHVKNTAVIPNIHTIRYDVSNNESGEFNKRSGLLFIGGYNHPPNTDAVVWLVKQIMPLVWKKIPDMNVTLLGNNPNKEVLKLISEQVHVPGFIDDVTPHFNAHKVFVAPLRYGAGMKGKIGQSLEFGLPVISTGIGVEGMNMIHEKNVLVAETEQSLADCIIKLYTDEQLWNTLRSEGHNVLHPYTAEPITEKIKTILESL